MLMPPTGLTPPAANGHRRQSRRNRGNEPRASARRPPPHPRRPGCAECEDCGGPIPDARRRAYPSATRCTECQARHERHAKNR
ncbi:TraR/DksA C4-type zinc finger protein [Cardiobacterium valvarum]|uniref:TraR/DksA C4-type zinc finger protein n=1 Tax=Cardiobacterium valvarum TaxID=194702 RepID=UPI0035E52D40